MTYAGLLLELNALADKKYRDFQKKLIATNADILGVRVPQLRKLAQKYRDDLKELLMMPDEYFEVTFLKCLVLGKQDFATFTEGLGEVLPLIDNWATCDCFDAPCIKKNKSDFLPRIAALRFSEHEFTSRFALVQLLKHYCEEEYLPFIFESTEGCDHAKYYVSMAAAWLIAEVLIKHYAAGVEFLKEGTLPAVTHNRAIQKARESFRLTAEQKEELKALKR